MQYTSSQSPSLTLSASTESKTYLLFTVAMALTVAGNILGMMFAATLMQSGLLLILAIVELAIIFTSGWWSKSSPLNYIMFAAFPLLSGFTLTPYILMVLAGYTNGSAILFNALAATVFMTLSAAVFARMAGKALSSIGGGLLLAVVGLIVLGILQIFVPALRTGTFELFLSAAGIGIFAIFTAYDIRRIQEQGSLGANPFMLALSLYLDIYNLFLFILRFMTAFSGDRR